MQLQNKPLLVLTGPTAVGKTKLSLNLARAVSGQIISADSMQVYREMNIGTAKIMPDEMKGIKHHLIDICNPNEDFNIYQFQKYSNQAISLIYDENQIPIITGGTGFYIQSVLYNVDFQSSDNDSKIRNELEKLCEEKGNLYIYNILKEIDEESALAIHPNNSKRVIRAIEYFRQTGCKISEHNKEQAEHKSDYNFLYFVLTMNRQALYDRIDMRVDKMISDGLVEEVKNVYTKYPDTSLVSMAGLGYKEIISYLKGDLSLEEAIYIIKRDTRHFAKRQLTWFRREKNVTWINKDDFKTEDDILDYMIKLCKDKNII